jgi:hypothetical protein
MIPLPPVLKTCPLVRSAAGCDQRKALLPFWDEKFVILFNVELGDLASNRMLISFT